MTKQTPNITYKMIQRVSLSGLSHHEYALVAQLIEPGNELSLETDPGNPYDKYAIKVMFLLADHDPVQVGWIPKGQNEMLFRLLKTGADVRCKVISHELDKPLASRLYVANYIAITE